MGWVRDARNALRDGNAIEVCPFGGSMRGRIESGQMVRLVPINPAEVDADDVVFVRLGTDWLLHLVIEVEDDRLLIGNNIGGINGWVDRADVLGRLDESRIGRMECLTSSQGDRVHIVRYRPGVLRSDDPPHDPVADVFVVLADPPELVPVDRFDSIALELANHRNDWIEIIGPHSEDLHDTVDHASVRIGRQSRVGDGFPMTAWDDRFDPDETADRIMGRGGFGGHDLKVVLVVTQDDGMFDRVVTALRRLATG